MRARAENNTIPLLMIMLMTVMVMHHLRYDLYNIWLRHVSRSCSIKNNMSRKLTRFIRGRNAGGAEPVAPIELNIAPPYHI